MAWKLENIRKDPNSKEMYADLFISQITEEPKTACLFTIGDARTVEIILEKYKNTQFVVFDYPALIKFLEFAKPANLLKAVPLRYDWESEDTFLKFVETEIRQIYNINNMSFDLIIANPPYGYASTLSISITKMCMKQSHEVVCLAPLKTFRGPEVEPFIEFLENIGNLGDYFMDATLPNICIAHITPDKKYERDFFRTYILTKKQQQIQQAIDDYNSNHSFSYKAQSNIIGQGFYEKLYLPNFEKIFLITWRGEGDGVHKKGGKDMMHNLEGKIAECVGGSASGLIFKTKQERDNFAKWWYSCNEKRDNKDKIGLTNFLLDLICAFAGGGGRMKFYFENFPAIDWSRTWTDEEILRELGLPENFLEEKE